MFLRTLIVLSLVDSHPWLSKRLVLLSPVDFWPSTSMVMWILIVLPVVDSLYGCQWSLFRCHQLTSGYPSMFMWTLIVLSLVDSHPWLFDSMVLLPPVDLWPYTSMVMWTLIWLPIVDSLPWLSSSLALLSELTSDRLLACSWEPLLCGLLLTLIHGCPKDWFCCHQLTSGRLPAWSMPCW
jgi:hypothetical protein